MMERRWLRWIGLAAALAILDASLTFHNIWPTPLSAGRVSFLSSWPRAS